MAQLKNDEWPSDQEQTTTEDQDRPTTVDEVVGVGPETPPNGSDDDAEIRNVEPDQLTD